MGFRRCTLLSNLATFRDSMGMSSNGDFDHDRPGVPLRGPEGFYGPARRTGHNGVTRDRFRTYAARGRLEIAAAASEGEGWPNSTCIGPLPTTINLKKGPLGHREYSFGSRVGLPNRPTTRRARWFPNHFTSNPHAGKDSVDTFSTLPIVLSAPGFF